MTDTSRLRIGLNLLYLRPGIVGGTETYARGLVEGLDELGPHAHFTVFLNRSAADWQLPSRFARVVCPVGPRQGPRYLYEQTRLPLQARAHGLNLLHSLAYVGPVKAPCTSVVTVPDLNYRSPTHAMPLARRLALSTFVSAVVRRSDAVIAISHFVADEIRAAMPGTGAKIHVVHLAPQRRADRKETIASSRRAEPYFVAFSSVSPNKNLTRLIEAHAKARSAGLTHSLVLVGHRPPPPNEDAPGVEWTGYLPGEEAARVLENADALIFPSLYEGFGLPVLEAMQSGVAVACSDRASLPEVAGDAALYFDPEDVESIANVMLRLGGDSVLRADLAARGLARAAEFSWRRVARETLEVYDWALEQRGA